MKLCFSNLFCIDWSAQELKELLSRHNVFGVELRTDAEGGFPYDKDLNIVDIGTGVCLKGYDVAGINTAKLVLDKIAETKILGIRIFLGNFARRFDVELAPIDHEGIVAALKELCDYTQKEIWVETHNEYATGKVLKELIREVDRSNLKIIWDIVHPIEDGEDYKTTFDLIGKHIAHVHIKDAVPHEDKIWHDYKYKRLGEGILPISEIVTLLNENGYDGYFSLEWESLWREELSSLGLSPDEILGAFVEYMDKIAERYMYWFQGEYSKELSDKALSSMTEDGFWEDIDYTGEKVPFWRVVEHLRRLNHMTSNGEIDAVMKGLEYWYSEERIDSNWWWNDIGFPMELAECGVAIRHKLSPELKEKLINTFNSTVTDYWTGTNRAWLAQNVIVRGILEENIDMINAGRKIFDDNIFIAKPGEEGIQYDFAFAQHGRQLYNNGYGISMLVDSLRWIDIFAGTDLAFSEEKVDILCKFFLEGSARMGFCEVPDFNTIGRDIVRSFKARDVRMKNYLTAIEILKKITDRGEELDKVEKFINGDSFAWEHIKMFSSLNILTSLKNGFYSSVRFGSKLVMGADICGGKIVNGEDKLSGYRGSFVSEYMLTGREYDRIFPLFNWAFLPGVSCPDTEIISEQGAFMESTFAGGISDEKYGLCAIDMNEDFSGDEIVKFGGRKAAFFTGEEVIHLGSGLYSETNLHTTLNQCYVDEDLAIDGKPCKKGCFDVSAKYIVNGKIGYIFPETQDVTVKAETKEELWNRITEMPEQIMQKGDVLTAYIDHDNSDSYVYSVVPHCDKDKAEGYKFPEFINSKNAQAVIKDGVVLVVFYEAGSIAAMGKTISCDKPCFAIVNKDGVRVSVPEGYENAEVIVK